MYPINAREFRLGLPQSKYRTHVSFRSPQYLPFLHRQFALLHKSFMEYTGLYMIPMQALILHFVLYGNFMLIRHSGQLNMFSRLATPSWLALALIFWSLVLH